MDLRTLRPTSDTVSATNEAIERCMVASKGCLAMAEQFRRTRVGLLMTGHPNELRQNKQDIASVLVADEEIRELVDHLQARLRELAPEQTAEVAALGELQTAIKQTNAAAETARATGANVVPLTAPRPVA